MPEHGDQRVRVAGAGRGEPAPARGAARSRRRAPAIARSIASGARGSRGAAVRGELEEPGEERVPARRPGSSKPGRAGVAAVAREQVAAGLERRAEVERAVAAARGADRVAELRADDRRSTEVLGQPRRDQPDDARRSTGRGRSSRTGSPSRPPAARASRRCVSSGRAARGWRPRARRRAGRRPRRSSASRSRAASIASPTRPAALSRGARANATVSRSTAAGSTRARASRAAIPGRGAAPHPLESEPGDRPVLADDRRDVGDACRSVARSARSSAAAAPPGSSARSACATLNATPLPASRRSG